MGERGEWEGGTATRRWACLGRNVLSLSPFTVVRFIFFPVAFQSLGLTRPPFRHHEVSDGKNLEIFNSNSSNRVLKATDKQ